MLAKFIIGIIITATVGLPIVALEHSQGWHRNWDGPHPNGPPTVHAVPGPVAGVGLPVLLVAGGYALWRQKKRQASKESTSD